jgi:hypothetical protein
VHCQKQSFTLSFDLQGETEKALELAQADAQLKFINANNAVSYSSILDYYAEKERSSPFLS